MTLHEDDSQNPYRATIIDEKPVEVAGFFRVEPQYRKLVRGSLGRIGYSVFMQYKWRFIGLGAAHVLIFTCSLVVFFLLLVLSTRTIHLFQWPLVVTAVLFILLLLAFLNVLSIHAALCILRKEKMIFFSTSRDVVQLALRVLHTLIYMVAWLGLLMLLFTPLWGIGIALDNSDVRLSDATLAFVVISGVILFIAWAIVVIVPMTRLFYGVYFIIDRRMNCLAAARASWRHTRGNILAVTFKDHGLTARNFTLIALAYLTLGVVLIGYVYCEVTVTYLMLTGQCDLLEQQPDEW